MHNTSAWSRKLYRKHKILAELDQYRDLHRDFFDPSKQVMKNSEEAPLLADNDSMEDAGAYQSSLRKDGDLKQSSLERLWIWLRNHLLMVAISILLIGGLVTLSIYFACDSMAFLMLQIPY